MKGCSKIEYDKNWMQIFVYFENIHAEISEEKNLALGSHFCFRERLMALQVHMAMKASE